MRQSRLAAIVLGLACSVCAGAQTTSSQQLPPGYRGVQQFVPGIFLTPVPNSPFSGQVDIVSHEKLPDGSEHLTMAHNYLARSSSGRIYQEAHPMATAELLGKTPVLSEHIYDPSSRQSIMVFPLRRLARSVILRGPERMPANALPPAQQPQDAGITETDLGTQTLQGMELRGIRKERVVPAEFSGTGKPVTITDEYWYSEDLSIYMIIRHNDPRTGEQLVAVTKVDRAEPPATQFTVPPDFKLVDETTPESPVAAQ